MRKTKLKPVRRKTVKHMEKTPTLVELEEVGEPEPLIDNDKVWIENLEVLEHEDNKFCKGCKVREECVIDRIAMVAYCDRKSV